MKPIKRVVSHIFFLKYFNEVISILFLSSLWYYFHEKCYFPAVRPILIWRWPCSAKNIIQSLSPLAQWLSPRDPQNNALGNQPSRFGCEHTIMWIQNQEITNLPGRSLAYFDVYCNPEAKTLRKHYLVNTKQWLNELVREMSDLLRCLLQSRRNQ